ncbi:MAG: NAD(P)-binding domain-containing protein, partial [Chloroflexota bacterium]|nr:NAD(P)-binding domain-containing protein [Chloroflexota bacterium]
MAERVGFIGLGIMGGGMAANLVRAEFPVRVWNRTPARMEPLLALGAQPATSPADVAAGSDVIITCVSDTPDVEAGILGEDGVIHGASPGALVIDMST